MGPKFEILIKKFPTLNLISSIQGEKQEDGWKRQYIKDKNLFNAQLGPTGGYKGYGTITGELPSEKSVCWWINDKIMPEIYVYRGQTYSFRVQVKIIASADPIP